MENQPGVDQLWKILPGASLPPAGRLCMCLCSLCLSTNQVTSAKLRKTRQRNEKGIQKDARREKEVKDTRQNTILQKKIKEKMRRKESIEIWVRTDIFPLKGKKKSPGLFLGMVTSQNTSATCLTSIERVCVCRAEFNSFSHNSNRCLKSVFVSREKHPEKETRKAPAPPSWLQRDLKVRFIDKDFKGGRYYNAKVLKYQEPLQGFTISVSSSGSLSCCFKTESFSIPIDAGGGRPHTNFLRVSNRRGTNRRWWVTVASQSHMFLLFPYCFNVKKSLCSDHKVTRVCPCQMWSRTCLKRSSPKVTTKPSWLSWASREDR